VVMGMWGGTAGLRLETVRGLGFLELLCAGRLDPRSAPRLCHELIRLLYQHGRVVADVAGLTIADECLGVFREAYETAGGWPAVRLVLYSVPDEWADRLRRTGLAPYVPIAPDLAAAVPLLNRRPVRVSRTADLPSGDPGTQAARALATGCGYDWGLSESVRLKAAMLLSELTVAAGQRAAVRRQAGVELRKRALHVTLREWSADGDPDELTRVTLTTLADRWTADPRPDGALVTADLYL